MNVTLSFNKTLFSFDVSKEKRISYIKNIAGKVFHLAKETISMYYTDRQIMNLDLMIKDYFTNESKVIIEIEGVKINLPLPIADLNNRILKGFKTIKALSVNSCHKQSSFVISPDNKSVSSNTISAISSHCYSCHKKEATWFCRTCDSYLCNTCQRSTNLHDDHKEIRLETNSSSQSMLLYKRQLIEDIKQTEKDLKESQCESAENLIYKEVKTFQMTMKNILNLKEDICLQFPINNFKGNYFEILMNKVFSIHPNQNELSEPIEGIFKLLQNSDKELNKIKEETKACKIKYEFKKTIYTIIKTMNTLLETTLKDINSIYQNSLNNKMGMLNEIEQFNMRNNPNGNVHNNSNPIDVNANNDKPNTNNIRQGISSNNNNNNNNSNSNNKCKDNQKYDIIPDNHNQNHENIKKKIQLSELVIKSNQTRNSNKKNNLKIKSNTMFIANPITELTDNDNNTLVNMNSFEIENELDPLHIHQKPLLHHQKLTNQNQSPSPSKNYQQQLHVKYKSSKNENTLPLPKIGISANNDTTNISNIIPLAVIGESKSKLFGSTKNMKRKNNTIMKKNILLESNKNRISCSPIKSFPLDQFSSYITENQLYTQRGQPSKYITVDGISRFDLITEPAISRDEFLNDNCNRIFNNADYVNKERDMIINEQDLHENIEKNKEIFYDERQDNKKEKSTDKHVFRHVEKYDSEDIQDYVHDNDNEVDSEQEGLHDENNEQNEKNLHLSPLMSNEFQQHKKRRESIVATNAVDPLRKASTRLKRKKTKNYIDNII